MIKNYKLCSIVSSTYSLETEDSYEHILSILTLTLSTQYFPDCLCKRRVKGNAFIFVHYSP
jgi:hypothetical protein